MTTNRLTEESSKCTLETGISCQGAEGPCDSLNATRYRQRTAYVNEELNWVTLCPSCREVNNAYWNERWSEYYTDCM